MEETQIIRGEQLMMTSDVITTNKLDAYMGLMELFTDFTDPKVQRQVKQK